MWHMGERWGWWMFFGMLMMAGFWLAIIWVLVAIARRLSDQSENKTPHKELTALEILERRYAGGELSEEEFVAMKRRLIS
jgi:putative membrane protein